MDILTLDVGILWTDDLELRSPLSIAIFTFCSLGMVFSTTAVILLFLTALLFEEWRKVYKNQILLQLMFCRFFYTIVRYETELRRFVSGKKVEVQRSYVTMALVTYTEIALVAWMFLFTKQMYDNFVRILFVEISLWKISLAAWTLPIVKTVILYLFVHKSDSDRIYFMIYLLIAKWPILLANGILLIIILKTIISDNKSRKIKNRRIIIVMIWMIISFSFQQLIWDGYKLVHTMCTDVDRSHSPLFFKLTNMFTVYQCAASILFWLYGNKKTRVMWGMAKESNIKKQPSLTSVSTGSTKI